jgi:single-stranded-DNA-specific exonuclease
MKSDETALLDPETLPGMTDAVNRIKDALFNNECVGIFGDFDTDGVTATALLYQALTSWGLRVIPYIPHRSREGHGLNLTAIEQFRRQGVTLMITVDCGVSSADEIEEAKNLGIDTIVTDHHLPPNELPKGVPIVNPHVPMSRYPFPDLTGVGLAFKLVQGLAQALDMTWDPKLLELAALGTIADVGPLRDENRYLVKAGINQLKQTQSPGLLALCRKARLIPHHIDAEAIAFTLSPRLNAAGRMEHAATSLQLLITRSEAEADDLAQEIDEMNRHRQRLSRKFNEQALSLAEARKHDPIVIVESFDFTPGLVGLVASKLVDTFNRPAIAIAFEGDVGRGSARSIPSVNIGQILDGCEDLLDRHGGHSQAAGFTLQRSRLEKFRKRILELTSDFNLADSADLKIVIDAEVSPKELLGDTYSFLQGLEPFGSGNPPPVFLTRRFEVIEARKVGREGEHLSMKVRENGTIWDAIAFRQGSFWEPGTREVDLVYRLTEDTRQVSTHLRLTVLDFECH